MGLPVRVVFFTYGDNNQWSFVVYRKHPVIRPGFVRRMGMIRHDEAVAAAKALGLLPGDLIFLGYPDFGTLHMWNDYWAARPPFRSMLTRVTAVPYPNALRPGALYKGDEVLQDLTTVLREFRPTKVFVSHPADHMPDHLALYLFTRVALWDLESELTPELYPYLVHFTFKRWPTPRGDHPDKALTPPPSFAQQIAWQIHPLSSQQIERKRAALKAHRTQYSTSATYLRSFLRTNELFGDFPVFTLRPPASTASLALDGTPHAIGTPEELTDVERAAFVGIEVRSAQIDNEALTLTIEFSRPLAQAVEASVYAFGYRRDHPFAHMPKLHLKLGAATHEVYDQDRRLPPGRVQITRAPKQIVFRVPLDLLGNPERVLVSARSYLGEVPLDWVSWRVLELAPKR